MFGQLPQLGHLSNGEQMTASKYQLIWQNMEGERLRYLAAIAALVAASCFLYLVPLVSSIVLGGVIADASTNPSLFTRRAVELAGGRDYLRQHLWLVFVVIVTLTGIAGFFTWLRGRWSAFATERITRSVRDRLYDQLQHLPCDWYDTAQTGDLVQRCTSDVETLRQFLINQVVEIGRALLMLLIPLPLMFFIDARMAVLSLLLIPPIVAFSVVFFHKVRNRFEEVDKAEGRLTSTLQENLSGIRVVRAFARQEYEIGKFAARNQEHRDLHFSLYRLLAGYWSVSDLLCGVQIAVVVLFGAVRLAEGSLGIGSFFFFLSVVNMFLWPVRMMGRILTELGKATVAIGRIHEILGQHRESRPATGIADTSADADETGAITFDRVTFAHRGAAPAVQDVSFRIDAGRTIGVLGPSGSGKSTVVNLLLRFYDPDEGRIEIDGQDISMLDRHDVRRRISVVMQEPFLYSTTIRENIAVGHAAAVEDEIRQAADAACVHDAITGLEAGYDTVVGERGITLSGGQRQRVALARALLKDPAILILDDALSAVDTETEALILEAIRRRRGRHTTLLIAHRLSTLTDCDEILVLDRGRVVQRGHPDVLRTEPGLYRRIWSIQNRLEEQLENDLNTAARVGKEGV
jgi:ATP-binding cassette subfamily B protein